MDFQVIKSEKSPGGGRKRKSERAGGIVKKVKLEITSDCYEQYVRPLECGWKRELVMRSIVNGIKKEKRSDVYYYPPKGKKLRSMTEVISYLQINDTEAQLTSGNFSFRQEVLTKHVNEWVRTARENKSSPFKTPNLVAMVSSPVANGPERPLNTPNSKNNSLNSNANTPNNAVNESPSSDIFHPPFNTPNTTINTPNTTINTPNTTINTPNTTINTPNSTLNTPNTTLNTLNTTLNTPNTTLNTPNSTFNTPKLPRKYGRPKGSKNKKSDFWADGGIKVEGSDKRIIPCGEKISMDNILFGDDNKTLTRSKSRKSLTFADVPEKNEVLAPSLSSPIPAISSSMSTSSSSPPSTSTPLVSPSLPILPPPSSMTPSSSTTPLKLCNLRCPGLENVCPTLECKRCKSLFHPECVGSAGSEAESYFCQVCKNSTMSITTPSTSKPCLNNNNQTFSNMLKSLSQKYRKISPAITTSITTNAVSSTPSAISESLNVANTPFQVANFVQNNVPTQTTQLNLPTFTFPLYGGNNQISYPTSNNIPNYLSSYFLMPQTFVNPSPMAGFPSPILAQNVLGTACNPGSMYPSICLQPPSNPNIFGQTLNFQPLNQIYQTFTLANQPISTLANDSQISRGVIDSGIESSSSGIKDAEIMPEADPTSQQQLNNNKLIPFKKRIRGVDKNSDSSKAGSVPASDCIGEQSIKAVPLFVHDGSSKVFEPTILSNGVVSKIILPDYDIFGMPINGGSEELISPSVPTSDTNDAIPGEPRTKPTSIASTTTTTTESSSRVNSSFECVERDSIISPVDVNITDMNITDSSIDDDDNDHDNDVDDVNDDDHSSCEVGHQTTELPSFASDEGIVLIPTHSNSTLNSGTDDDARNIHTPNNSFNEVDEDDNNDDDDDDEGMKENDDENDVSSPRMDYSSNDQSISIDQSISTNQSNSIDPSISINSNSNFTLSESTSRQNLEIEVSTTTSPEIVATTTTDNTLSLSRYLLRKIFRYLTTYELLVTSRVCKRWGQISRSEDLWVSLEITNELLENMTPDLSQSLCLGITEFKPQLLDLRRIDLEVVFDSFLDMTSSLPSETSTSITAVSMATCPPHHLQRINDAFERVAFLSLTLKGRHVISGDGHDDDVRSLVRVLANFRSLKILQIYEEGPGIDSVVNGDAPPTTNGEVFETMGGGDDDDVASRCFPELEELRLFGPSHRSSFKKLLMASRFDKLSNLTISDCRGWDNQMFSMLGNLEDLTTLDLRRGGSIPDPGLGLALAKMKRLNELRLTNFVLDWTLSSSIQKLSHLRILHIRPDTNLSNADKAPYINLCCMSAIWNHRDLQELTWETSTNPDGTLPFQMCDTTKLKSKAADVDGDVVATGDRLLFLNVSDLLLKLQTSLPNTKVKIQVV